MQSRLQVETVNDVRKYLSFLDPPEHNASTQILTLMIFGRRHPSNRKHQDTHRHLFHDIARGFLGTRAIGSALTVGTAHTAARSATNTATRSRGKSNSVACRDQRFLHALAVIATLALAIWTFAAGTSNAVVGGCHRSSLRIQRDHDRLNTRTTLQSLLDSADAAAADHLGGHGKRESGHG